MNNVYDVIIIGAGFAGLSAGLKLKEAGLNTCILEARNRVGGRTETKWLDGNIQIDLGGQWIGPTQDRMYELVKKYTLQTFPTQLFGKNQYHCFEDIYEQEPKEMTELYEIIDRLASQVNLDHPIASPDIEFQDRITFHQWLFSQTDNEEIVAFTGRILAGGLLASDAGEISLFQMLYYIKAGNGIKCLLNALGGAQQDKIVGGPQKLAQAMVEDYGKTIFYNQPVVKIKQTEAGYHVSTKYGTYFEGKYVLLALPPSVINEQIMFQPELPVLKKKMLQTILPGSASKYHAVYDKPFWRYKGLSGQRNMSKGLIIESIDNSNMGFSQGIITFFVYGTDSVQLNKLSEDEVQKLLLEELSHLYGEEARQPNHFLTQDWNQEIYTNGCFTGHFVPGGFIKYGDQLRAEVGNIHWAGTETATVWNGYFEGAVRSGEREALKIIEKESN